MKRKLIEVALPLEAINRESAREKSIRHGHPSTLHLWWARRPLAAARAVLFAQMVDDPSSHPEQFPTEEDQRAERERLHRLIERLVVWENSRDEKLLAEAHAEIVKSCDGNPPPILDPFAGGGTIPLEAQRLGLEAHASDLNPVAVLINKAMIEIPPKFRDQPPTFPGLAQSEIRAWSGAEGLAADVRAYGAWMRDEAEKRLGHLYPKATMPDESQANVIAWLWARTVTCPNPACGIEMPLVRSWWLGKKKGREAYILPSVVADRTHPSGRRVAFRVGHDPRSAPTPENDGTVTGRKGATCVACDSLAPIAHLREQFRAGAGGITLMATVADGNRRRIYLAPDETQIRAACIDKTPDRVEGAIAENARWFSPPMYGLTQFSDLFTNRQLITLQFFSDLVAEVRERVLDDASAMGLGRGRRLEEGGLEADAYADALATFLGLMMSGPLARNCTIASWDSGPTGSHSSTGGSARTEHVRSAFARQALPMTWDFAEANLLGESGASYASAFKWFVPAVERLDGMVPGVVRQQDAASASFAGGVISTDPPYYDNIGYSDLSDFFYVWIRRSLKTIYPSLLSTLLVPKQEELVANPYRHDGREGARQFFEKGFQDVFANARLAANPDFPITVWYAFKQAESSREGTTFSGWETLLDGMIRSGWAITATWPNRSELANRMIASRTNALASSIVLALRPRVSGAPTTDRRGLISALQAELPVALRRLQQGAIAPVDLPQAAIGPGMAVFSRYAKVLEPDGSPMTVRSALARINEILDQVLGEQEGDFDSTTRFAIAWYRQHGYNVGKFGDADSLARARNTAVEHMDREEILTSRAGRVALVKPAESPTNYNVLAGQHTSSWEVLHHAIRILESEGVPAVGQLFEAARTRADVDLDLVKELAFLLFPIAEKNGWTKDAVSFNAVAQSWGDVLDASKSSKSSYIERELNFSEDDA